MRVKNLNSIQVFETVARLSNITHAANFLNTSQSTVSYHIRKLETQTGKTLFERNGGGLVLTDEGEILANYADQALSLIETGLSKILYRTEMVRVAVLPMFASRWLSSRLEGMWQAHPDLQISFLNHNNDYVRHERAASFADIGIQWGRGDWENFDVTRLWQEELVVVCSPGYLQSNPIIDLASLRRCVLLHVDDKRMWSEVLKNNLIEIGSDQKHMMLEDRHFQLNATINGVGVSLFSKRMIEMELVSGALVNPLGRSFKSSFSYHMAVPKGAVLSPSAERFKNWLIDRCRNDQPWGDD
ncbi:MULTISPECIES: LysR substrate-binding domain-containing protein [Thioclava]|uniref:Transcriptional regulator n=1 Tax=Thioclava nitratireducens TaxID=1915078 RepID=A0ABN4XCL2_9RHOB|nr:MULTISPECIES: LysR substrate-binding domain-containing protein [Thioclava]AQS47193.1 transcriptional regulator [Thioclava nitratireducens]OWX98489.1 transcriptional regulator [Thioclava sp. IC9]